MKTIREILLEEVGLLTVSGAASFLRRTEKAVQTYVNRGLIPVVIVGRTYLLRARDVKRFKLPTLGRPKS